MKNFFRKCLPCGKPCLVAPETTVVYDKVTHLPIPQKIYSEYTETTFDPDLQLTVVNRVMRVEPGFFGDNVSR